MRAGAVSRKAWRRCGGVLERILPAGAALRLGFPCVNHNLVKLRKHRIKRALPRAARLPAWPRPKQP
jgi:hypothetical protein